MSVGGWEPTGPAGCRPLDIGLEHRGRHPWVGGLDPVCAEGWPQSRLGGVEGGRGLRSVWGCVQGSAVCSTEAAAVAALSPRPRGQLRLWVARLPVPPALSPGSLRSALSSARDRLLGVVGQPREAPRHSTSHCGVCQALDPGYTLRRVDSNGIGNNKVNQIKSAIYPEESVSEETAGRSVGEGPSAPERNSASSGNEDKSP